MSGKSGGTPRLPAPNSSRVLPARTELFLHPSSLGSPMKEFGKAHVVALANGGQLPRFSKYSGVLEWSNAVFLWVNVLDEGGGSYKNEFLHGGKTLVWFGGSRLHSGESCICLAAVFVCDLIWVSPGYRSCIGPAPFWHPPGVAGSDLVHRLAKSADDGAREAGGGEDDCVMLFMRKPGEPYCCLGRLSLAQYGSSAGSNLRFEWRLRDFPALTEGPGSHNFWDLVHSLGCQ